MGVEIKVGEKARRNRIQQKVAITLFRLTTRNARLTFAPESYVRKHLGFNESQKINHRMRQALQRLESRGLIERESGSWKSRLTAAGEKFAEKIEAAERLQIKKPKRWDEKWRVVIFDVPEKYKASRDRFRRILQKAGFLRLQDSVWIHPYDCEELVAFMRKDLRLGGNVLYMIVEGLEGESRVRIHFKLD